MHGDAHIRFQNQNAIGPFQRKSRLGIRVFAVVVNHVIEAVLTKALGDGIPLHLIPILL